MHNGKRMMLAGLYNSSLAGHPASQAMHEALTLHWIPAMTALLEREPGADIQVRRLIVRLGWLLRHLPQAQAIHAELLRRAIREFRMHWDKLAPALFGNVAEQVRNTDLLEAELLAALRTATNCTEHRSHGRRHPLHPLLTESPAHPSAHHPHLEHDRHANVSRPHRTAHPHDLGVPAAWQSVLHGSRERKREQGTAVALMTRAAGLRAGERLLISLPGGGQETWRVVRNEPSGRHLLVENEDTRRHGVMGLKSVADQMASGRLSILR